MAKGSIKKLVPERGFGFILAEDGKELFFHRSGLQGLDYDTMQEGQNVEFDVEQSDKGPRAVNVKASE